MADEFETYGVRYDVYRRGFRNYVIIDRHERPVTGRIKSRKIADALCHPMVTAYLAGREEKGVAI